MSASVRWCLLVLLVAVTLSQQHPAKNTPTQSPDAISLDEVSTAKARPTRTVKKIQQKLGFFGTVKKLIFDQINDTKSAYNQISEMVSGNFASEEEGKHSKKKKPEVVTEPPDDGDTEGRTTTEPPPEKITRQEFLDIIRRNLIGLRRLFNDEWKMAMKDSKTNIQDYKNQFKSEMYKY